MITKEIIEMVIESLREMIMSIKVMEIDIEKMKIDMIEILIEETIEMIIKESIFDEIITKQETIKNIIEMITIDLDMIKKIIKETIIAREDMSKESKTIIEDLVTKEDKANM